MTLILKGEGLLLKDSGLAAVPAGAIPCDCCEYWEACVKIQCYEWSWFIGNCSQPGIFPHTITIPECYTLPVPINIRGGVNDDLLLDGQSITTDLMLDPGPYPDTVGLGCVGGHTIGEKPGPFADAANGGITFPMDKRSFEISCRDSIGSGAELDITICVDPNKTRECRKGLLVQGSCPRSRKQAAMTSEGPGTELSMLLEGFWIRSDGDCQCKKRADLMNQMGPQWCRDNIETISKWLRDESKRRGIPYFDWLGRQVILKAIENWEAKQMPLDGAGPT